MEGKSENHNSGINHPHTASAVWTRFNPVMLAIQKAIHEDDLIGEIRCMYSDHSMDAYKKRPDTDRVLAAELAGGSLLDIGPYPLVWVSFSVHPSLTMAKG